MISFWFEFGFQIDFVLLFDFPLCFDKSWTFLGRQKFWHAPGISLPLEATVPQREYSEYELPDIQNR